MYSPEVGAQELLGLEGPFSATPPCARLTPTFGEAIGPQCPVKMSTEPGGMPSISGGALVSDLKSEAHGPRPGC